MKVYTNAELKDQNAAQFTERAAELLAKELGKPIRYVVVSLAVHATMSFGGNPQNKGVLAYLDSVGFGARKESLIKLLTEFFNDRLEGLDLNNINIVTTDLPANDVAIGGELLG